MEVYIIIENINDEDYILTNTQLVDNTLLDYIIDINDDIFQTNDFMKSQTEKLKEIVIDINDED